ncbi:hypothetical protein HYFRA_00013402 [Hymenoscyphus fraxineus]|uniref:C2H2-type domain-containing protein n=1 Tax=Hymenoscyphus fraxineus TaxID=746836 RepID=A0A9N9L7L9_9HELO|nr:hypothetical protein HYFRA_00013402 [Hymenoscyphus fraxineus]
MMPTTSTVAVAETPQEPRQERRPSEQRPILPKKCLYCERRFSKAEHLKRHQRSLQSDVLIRHLKNHPHIPGEEVEQSESDGDQRPPKSKRRTSASSVMSVAQLKKEAMGPTIQDQPQRSLSPSRIDPALLGSNSDFHEQTNSHAMASGLDHLALLASQQPWGNGAGDAAMTDSGSTVMGGQESQNWPQEPVSHNHEFGGVMNYQSGLPSTDADFQMIGAAVHPHPTLDFGGDMYSGRMGLQDQISPGMGGMTPNSGMMPHELLNWFDQFDMETSNPPEQPQPLDGSPPPRPQDERQPTTMSPDGGNSSNSGSLSTVIPAERFHKVERCWPNKPSNAVRLMPTLWRDAIMKPQDNLFSKDNLTPEAIEHNRQYGSRWGLDEDCRTRLQKMFVSLSRKESSHVLEENSPISHSSPSSKSSISHNIQEEISNIPNFPPAEIFDISLDLFFRQFHPLMPFIHTPTFCPKTAPTSILLIMCLIGLTILQTKGATAFVKQAFPRALEKVCTELMSPPRDGRRIDQLSCLASAIFILCLSEMTGDRAHHEQCQMLYTSAITTAQRHGLFNTKDVPPLEEHLFTAIPSIEVRWKAWARVECIKRMILCLPMVDTWYSAIFHTSPIMRTDEIRIILPCDAALFQATSAAKWDQLISKGARLCMPEFSMSSDKIKLPHLDTTLDVHGMVGLLSSVRLRISESFHRLLSGSQRRAIDHSFVPWKTYESDARAHASQTFTTQVMRSYGSMLSSMNPNCVILWHNMCIMLTTDQRLFELGAGCAGAEAAREALDDIAVWARTPAARRAILHAGQTFTLMANRRASDGDPFHSTSSLFVAALVLGLYVFMASPENPTTGPAFDLTEEVDWNVVGGEGLSNDSQLAQDDAAINFIQNGGRISFNGVVHQPGYPAARRILLDYARLLEDIGKWRVGVHQFSRVLRIMSDALVDVDNSGE